MKTRLLTSVLCAVTFLISSAAVSMGATAGYTLVRMNNNDGNRFYVTAGGEDVSTNSCEIGGTNCYVIVTVDGPDGPCDEVLPGGLLLQGKLSSIVGHHTNGTDTQSLSLGGFVFSGGEYQIRITSCSAFPSYVNMQVSMNGVQVAADGTFQVLFPYAP